MSWILDHYIKLLPYLAVAALVAFGWFYVHHQSAEIAGLKQKLVVAEANGAVAETTARNNAAALTAAQKQYAADALAVAAHHDNQAVAEKARVIILESIENAPASDDGPVAPVLLRALDCLREPTTAPPDTGDAFCKGGATARPVDVPEAARRAAKP